MSNSAQVQACMGAPNFLSSLTHALTLT